MCKNVFPSASSVFHAACALSAPSGHLPLEGKADDTGIQSAKMAAKPPPEPVEPRRLKAGMSGFEWLVTAYHFQALPLIKIDAKLCIKILANADPAIESAFP